MSTPNKVTFVKSTSYVFDIINYLIFSNLMCWLFKYLFVECEDGYFAFDDQPCIRCREGYYGHSCSYKCQCENIQRFADTISFSTKLIKPICNITLKFYPRKLFECQIEVVDDTIDLHVTRLCATIYSNMCITNYLI